MCTQVLWTARTDDGDLLAVGGDNLTGPRWCLRVDDVAERIQSGEWHFYVAPRDVARSDVLVRSRNGNTYLTTSPDDVKPNNLLNLPVVAYPGVSEPSWPGRLPPARKPVLVAVARSARPDTPARALPRARGAYPVLPGEVLVDVDAPWPGTFVVKAEHGRRPHGPELDRRSSSGPFALDDENARGWWEPQSVVPGRRISSRWRLRVHLPPHFLTGQDCRLSIAHSAPPGGCTKEAHRRSEPLFVPLMRERPRKSLDALSLVDRQVLADAIAAWVNDDWVRHHDNLSHSGEFFLIAHREMLSHLEEYLLDKGLHRFVPMPTWDPMTPIPEPLRLVKRRDDGVARTPLANTDPRWPLPPELTAQQLCALADGEAFAAALTPWHDDVHIRGVGGSMNNARSAAACLIFYPWHAYVDELYWSWQRCER